MKTISLIWLAGEMMAATLSMANAGADETDIQSLQQTVLALQQRVEAMEAIKPTFTGLMPNIAERFHTCLPQVGVLGKLGKY